MEQRTTLGVNRMRSILFFAFSLTQLVAPAWASPALTNIELSVPRPLMIESRIVNGFRFDIINPKDLHQFMANDWLALDFGDSYLIIRDEREFLPKVLVAETAGGKFSFIADNEYVVVYEWGGGKMSAFYVYATKPNLKEILSVSTDATRHEVISPNQLQLFEVSDIEGLAKCPPSDWPYDTVVYTFFPDRVDRHIKKKGEISEYCRSKLD